MERFTERRENLVQARKEILGTQEAAAALAGTTRATISDWERGLGGRHGDSYSEMEKYCKNLAGEAMRKGIPGDFSIRSLCPELFCKEVAA